MVDRLLGRMKPGQAIRQARFRHGRRADVHALLEITRSMLVGGSRKAATLHASVAQARPRPQDMVPLAGLGYRPTEKDEIGIWQLMERAEEEIAGSNLLIQDPKLTGYLKNLIGTVGGPAAKDFRIYLARIPTSTQ